MTETTELEKVMVLNARKSFIFKDGNPWVKKNDTGEDKMFDIPMGSYDGAECSDLVGLFLLEQLK